MPGRNRRRNWTRLRAAIVATALPIATVAAAQDLEPRSFSAAPVGIDFLLVGYGQSTGALLFDPSLPIEDAEAEIDGLVLAWARTFRLFGDTGKFTVVLPWFDGKAHGLVSGEPAERVLRGLGDARLAVTWLFVGAPARSPAEFARAERSPTAAGVSFALGIPVGEYDRDRLLNLGTHRWWLKSELGASRQIGRWTVEGSAAATLYQDNRQFAGGFTRAQAPLFSAQAHVVRDFKPRLWAALDLTYYWGGQTRIDGVKSGQELGNSRVGGTLSLPLRRNQSVKLSVATGISARTGTNFDSAAVTWQWLLPHRLVVREAKKGKEK